MYASAVPIAYAEICSEDWDKFAYAILEASYEMIFSIATILSRARNERVTLYLTKLGGGVFKNDSEWIKNAI